MILSRFHQLLASELQSGASNFYKGSNSYTEANAVWRKFRNYCTSVDSGKIKVEGNVDLHWERHGNGPNVVLCCPGLAGSVETNYGPIFRKMDLSTFTFVGVDPAGYGKSRPPDRRVNGNEFVLRKDARLAAQIMKELGYTKYSAFGWSTGGITATYVGLDHPDVIHKAVVCNPPYKLTIKTKKGIESLCSLKNWPEDYRKDILRIYGAEYAQKILNDWRMFLYKEIEEPMYYKEMSEDLVKVNFPVLYFATSQDVFMDSVNTLAVFDEMTASTLHPIARASHFHFEYLDELVKAMTKFLLKESAAAVNNDA